MGMKIISRLYDKKVNALNILVEIPILEYLKFAPDVLKRNEFQRRRVNAAGKIYSLLKNDLNKGCIIPPIVLAYLDKTNESIEYTKSNNEDLLKLIEQNIDNLLILDGLQRTYTMLDLYDDISGDNLSGDSKNISDIILRLEIYLGINRLGILYRMLTLNSGQTPMSFRHQIEILYSDYAVFRKESSIAGIKLITQADSANRKNLGEYNFSDIIDGFYSYIKREELPADREFILENIKNLEQLSKEDTKKDVFIEFVKIYNSFVLKINGLCEGYNYDNERIQEVTGKYLSGNPFGKDINTIFSAKSIPMTGFGSAIGKLIDFEIINDINELYDIINDIYFENNEADVGIYNLLIALDDVKSKSKKIGNSQRLFFHFFFRELFNKDSDSYRNINNAIQNGLNKYRSQMEL